MAWPEGSHPTASGLDSAHPAFAGAHFSYDTDGDPTGIIDYLDPGTLAAEEVSLPTISEASASAGSESIHDYLAAVDWRQPTPDEYVLFHRKARNEVLTVGERATVAIISESDKIITPALSKLLDFIAKEELLAQLDLQILNPTERDALVNDPRVLLREENPELFAASQVVRRNVGVFGKPALEGVELSLLSKK